MRIEHQEKGFQPVGHSKVAGCNTRIAMSKETVFVKGLIYRFVWTHALGEAMASDRWQIGSCLFPSTPRPMKQADCHEPENTHR